MIAVLALACLGASQSNDSLVNGWNNVPNSTRARMYWRVFGPAWDHANIDRQLKLVKAAGLGGVMTYFMYPFALDEPGKWHNQPFNSPEFLENLGYAVRSAKRLGLRFSICGSTGWPYGGSKVSVPDSAQMLKRLAGMVSNGTTTFKQPFRPNDGDQVVAYFQDGKWIAKPHDGPVVAFVEGPTRMQVKRPSLGNEGLVVDHLNSEAVTRYLESTVRPMLDSAPNGIESIFSDSLEVYRENWTHDFPKDFRNARGYDLIPHLEELFDDNAIHSKPLRQDFWRTVAELAETRYVKTLFDWSHRQGITTELQPYGTPPLPMTSSAFIDMPTAEHYEWMGFNVCRYVASAAHQQGKNLVGSEAWTWGAIPNRLTDTLSDLKVMSDMHFLSGVNDITGVDFPYSPKSAGVPGWLPYYGPSIGENNPQWAVFPELVNYLNRCSWMLRQGSPAAKVGVYLPIEDGMANGGTEQLLLDFAVRDHFVNGPLTSEFGLTKAMTHRSDLVTTLMKIGVEFDGLDFWSLNRAGHVEGSGTDAFFRVGQAKYSIIVLPRIESIDLNAYRILEAFSKKGGTVIAIGKLPSKALGLNETSADQEVRAISQRLFQRQPTSTGSLTTCFVKQDSDLEILTRGKVATVEMAVPSQTVAVVKRILEDCEIYFVANPNNSPNTVELKLLPQRKYLEIWYPMSGKIVSSREKSVTLSLSARGSQFVVATDRATPGSIADKTENKSEVIQEIKPVKDWMLSFKGPDAPPAMHLNSPIPWETLPGCQAFSGMGVYQTQFAMANPMAKTVYLGFRDIHDAAEVFINGKRAGAVWNPPYQLDITSLVHAGRNRLEIRVYNSMVNRFISLPDQDIKGLRAKYGNRFSAPEEKELMKSPALSGISSSPYLTLSARKGN